MEMATHLDTGRVKFLKQVLQKQVYDAGGVFVRCVALPLKQHLLARLRAAQHHDVDVAPFQQLVDIGLYAALEHILIGRASVKAVPELIHIVPAVMDRPGHGSKHCCASRAAPHD